jgi:hypothetical protein
MLIISFGLKSPEIFLIFSHKKGGPLIEVSVPLFFNQFYEIKINGLKIAFLGRHFHHIDHVLSGNLVPGVRT